MLSLRVNMSVPPLYLGFAGDNGATIDLPQGLAEFRKQHALTQAQLAERIGIHVIQLRRYEAGTSQPTLGVIRKLATSLQVSADIVLFGKDERGPDDDLRMQFEAVTRFDDEEKQAVRSLLEGMIRKHVARCWQTLSNGGERKEAR